MLKKLFSTTFILLGATLFAVAPCVAQSEYLSGMKWEEPPIVTPGKTCGALLRTRSSCSTARTSPPGRTATSGS